MTVGSVSGNNNVNNNSGIIKTKPLFPKEEESKGTNFSTDNINTSSEKTSRGTVPSTTNLFEEDAPICVEPENTGKGNGVKALSSSKLKDAGITIDSLKPNQNDIDMFNKLYKKLGSSLVDRASGAESETALAILLNEKLRKVATDQQKLNLMKIAAYALDHAQITDPNFFHALEKGIDNVIEDFKSTGKMSKLTEYLMIGMSQTGSIVSRIDDWGARKIAQNKKILDAMTPSQKSTLVYELKFGFTDRQDQQAINKILKNALEHGQVKSIFGHWSDGLDFTSTSLDSLYSNIKGPNKAEFLKIVSEAMDKEKINEKVMEDLYKANNILKDISSLRRATTLEKQGKYSEAGQILVDLGDTVKGKELLEKAGYQNYNNNNYLELVKNFVTYSKAEIKEGFDSVQNTIGLVRGNRVSRAVTSYVSDKIDDSLKSFPVLQSKNLIEIKEKRESQLQKLSQLSVPKRTPEEKALEHQKFEKLVDNLTGTKSYPGNEVKLLLDGEAAYNRLKQRILDAKESIFIEVFLFHDDQKGNEIADLLIKRANEGLDVRLVTDGPSNMADRKVLKKLENSKVKFFTYKGSFDNIIESRGMSGYHRKLYIFDKQTAMTGGINIGNEYLTKGKWHDLLVEVKGPVMSDTLNDFYRKWSFSSGDKVEKAPPPSAFKSYKTTETGTDLPFDTVSKARLITTSPTEDKQQIRTWMLMAINNAKERVYIEDPYFNDPEIIEALKKAINRGVKVEVIFPNSNDVAIMKHLDDNVIDELYAEGGNLFNYNTSGKESFNHLKATIIDDMVALGSSNKDVRAMKTNQEINYVFDDKKFAEQVIKEIWEKDKQNSTPAEPAPENFAKRLIKLGLKEAPSLF